jgi:hypothetical protein
LLLGPTARLTSSEKSGFLYVGWRREEERGGGGGGDEEERAKEEECITSYASLRGEKRGRERAQAQGTRSRESESD